MSLFLKEQSFMGNGDFLVKPYDDTDGYRKIGNCGEMKLAHTEDEKFVLDYTNSAGGKANSKTIITGVALSLSMYDRTASNIAMGSKGTAAAIASGAAVSEVHKGWHAEDRRIVLDHLSPTSIVVKDVTDVTTYVLDTDYTVSSVGLITILSTGSIGDGDTLHISYSYGAYNNVEALINSGIEYTCKFYGMNSAQSDTPVVITAHRVKFGASDEMSMISEDFVPLDITGEVLVDDTKVGGSLSKYYVVQQVEA